MIPKHKVLSNGAILQYLTHEKCSVCVGRKENPETPIAELYYQGQTLYLCEAHVQQLLEMDEDEKLRKEEGFDRLLKVTRK